MRFSRITGAISDSCDSIQSLLQWQSPTASILFILVSFRLFSLFFLLSYPAGCWNRVSLVRVMDRHSHSAIILYYRPCLRTFSSVFFSLGIVVRHMARSVPGPRRRRRIVEIDDELPRFPVITYLLPSVYHAPVSSLSGHPARTKTNSIVYPPRSQSPTVSVICVPLYVYFFFDHFHRGWLRHFGWAAGCDQPDADEAPSDGKSSVTERLTVVLQVARKVQNQLGTVCDAAEKIKKSVVQLFFLSIPIRLVIMLNLVFVVYGSA